MTDAAIEAHDQRSSEDPERPLIDEQTRTVFVRKRYRRLAPVYDYGLGERLLYTRARERAVELLRLAPGASVLDLVCGTGLNFPLIQERIGPAGTIVGVDLNPSMLSRARARVARSGWANVKLAEHQAATLTRDHLENAGALAVQQPIDAALCTLGLSVIPQWQAAWATMIALVRPGGRVAVMDGGYSPRPGTAREVTPARPLVWLICRAFAAEATTALGAGRP
jgi:demethylmenaquinone methyltransferase/2-methoxy-6-polyprenyl-1,4-benzoquinol methylase